MKPFKVALLCLGLLALPAVSSTAIGGDSPLLAFPGAEGAGRFAVGGRGGRVIKVTHLNDAGPGSLRAAVEASGPRTVVFEISGTIAFDRPLSIDEPNITIAGQTTPGPASKGQIAFKESNELAQAWFAGNTMDGVLPDDPWSLVAGKSTGAYRLSGPIEVAPVNAGPAAISHERVLREAGASYVRDTVDLRIVQSVRERSGKLINSQNDVAGWPKLKSLTPPTDADGDGMADDWERTNHFDPARADGNDADYRGGRALADPGGGEEERLSAPIERHRARSEVRLRASVGRSRRDHWRTTPRGRCCAMCAAVLR